MLSEIWNRARVALAATALLMATSVVASESNDPVGHMTAAASAVQWHVTAENEKVVLTVLTPDGTTYRREFTAGSTPSFRLQDLPERTGPDGAYGYDLRVVPRIPEEVKRQLADARLRDDDATVDRLQRSYGLTIPLQQSGGFTVDRGSFVDSGQSEQGHGQSRQVTNNGAGDSNSSSNSAVVSPNSVVRRIGANADVINDDLIVIGSACIGVDCVNPESFSFDTVRLKENNLRIKFQDTSAAPFPSTDWQLTANDSASGGPNKFSIDDITGSKTPFTVTGGAPTNSMFVASTGRVGFRTSTVGLDLHMSTTNTPGVRFEQNSSGGFPAQTWDIAANEAAFFVRDVTGGSKLPLRIRPGAPTSSIDIASSGSVGVGTNLPTFKLDVRAATQGDAIAIGGQRSPGLVFITNAPDATARNWGWYTNYNSFGDIALVRTTGNTGTPFLATGVLDIDINGNLGIGVTMPTSPIQHANGAILTAGGVWQNACSRALKDDVRDLSSEAALKTLTELNPVTYTYKADRQEKHVGFIAEDVPELVAAKDHKTLSSMDLVAVLTKVVQEQQKTIDTMQKRLEQLETKQQ